MSSWWKCNYKSKSWKRAEGELNTPTPPQSMGKPVKMLEKSTDNGTTIYVLTLICKYVK
jgi:hypothetical protein